MSIFVPIQGPVVADSAYIEDKLVARDVAATLPEITPTMVDVQAMGTMSLPIWQLIENMELALTKIGVDLGLCSMIEPKMKPIELRWVQNVTDENGITKNVGCKAFFRGVPSKIPGVGLTVGEQVENEVTFTVTRYNLFVDGREMYLIDRLAGIVRINGTDYAGAISSML